MSTIATIAALIGEIGVLIGVITPVIVSIQKILNGTANQRAALIESDFIEVSEKEYQAYISAEEISAEEAIGIITEGS